MVSHKYKCIFVHIPLCAGSSIEHWLYESDYWHVNPKNKHLLSRQAREVYVEYWSDYFKFSIVRDLFTRTDSMLKFKDHFGMQPCVSGSLDFSDHAKLFGENRIVEHDHRFYQRDQLLSHNHAPGQVYGNILDEPLDLIARFETLEADMNFLKEMLGCETALNCHLHQTLSDARYVLSPQDHQWVSKAYANDFAKYGYSHA